MADYEHNVSRWLEPFSRERPRILLHGIDVRKSECECHANEEDLVIPSMGKLMEAAQQNPSCKEFQWLAEDKKWVAIIL